MKNITFYAIALTILLFFSLFLPYSHHDIYAKSSFFLIRGVLNEAGIITNGFESWITVAVLLWSAAITLVVSIPQSTTNAIISLLFSVGLAIYMILILIMLTAHFTIGAGNYNYTLGIGFYLASIVSILFIVLTVVHLIKTIRFKKVELDF